MRGPRVCTASQGPGDPEVAGMGTSVEESLHESVASLEQAQHPFGENPPKAQPTPGRSAAELWGGRSRASRPVQSWRHFGVVAIRNSRRLRDPAEQGLCGE